MAQWLAVLMQDQRYRLWVLMPQKTPYEHNLHHIAKVFRESDCTHWLNMDADNPPTSSPLDYVCFDKDYIGFPTPINKRFEDKLMLVWNVQLPGGGFSSFRHSGLEEAEAVGTGCFLMSRRVVDAIRGPLFARVTDEEGLVTVGNDIAACERMREAGFTVWAAWDNVCSHYRDLDLSMLMPEIDDDATTDAIGRGNGKRLREPVHG